MGKTHIRDLWSPFAKVGDAWQHLPAQEPSSHQGSVGPQEKQQMVLQVEPMNGGLPRERSNPAGKAIQGHIYVEEEGSRCPLRLHDPADTTPIRKSCMQVLLILFNIF